ncbi:hypothetical protein GA0070616_2806 [Micromonospora nigra]|uniref:Secreted protein/lipoprotein n=1 Tax=Micromonospora nigra TaxID=145857 RepID=A0A1C6S379_9ACTN|nr:hypothetical protein [Micromonospora nigra]SCL23859.1 hypothetical protein GA0070616_2806 [Micromonospora nigra]
MRRQRCWAAGLLATLAVGPAAACAAEPEATTRTASDRRAAAPADRDAAQRAAAEAALAAYAGYLDASRAAGRHSDPRHPELARYVADPLLTKVRLALHRARENGAVGTGTLRSDPTVTTVDLEADPPTVEIQDCLDATGYRLVFTRNKRTVPGSDGSRHLATAVATRYPDGRWLISTGAAHQDQPC